MADRSRQPRPSAQEDFSNVISKVTLWQRRPLLMSGHVLPFVLAYAVWCGAGGRVGGDIAWYAGLGAIAGVQVMALLVSHWSIAAKCFFTCTKEPDPRKASVARVTPTPNNGSAELVPLQRTKEWEEEEDASEPGISRERGKERIFFVFQKVKYVWREKSDSPDSRGSNTSGQFVPLDYPTSLPLSDYLLSRGHQEQGIVDRATRKYGPNMLQMDIPEFMELFKERATAPFFVFQVVCVGLWCLDEYWYYSLFTLCMLVVFECTLVQQQLRNMAEIRRMGAKPYTVQVYRARRWRPVLTTTLVPGDIISVTRSTTTTTTTSSSSSSGSSSSSSGSDYLVPCDLLLLRGSCVVDESMLTGESIPQMKEGIAGPEDSRIASDSNNSRLLDLTTDSKLHVLYGGTKIVQHTAPMKTTTALRAPDGGCLCYVMRTGFATAQGRLLKTILYGVSRATANSMETLAFILFLLVFAVAAAAYVWFKGTEDPDRSRYKLFLECTLILTSVVPPELPIELSLAVNTSLLSLSKLSVFCTEPFRIPFAGKVDVACFDKTGTLTSDDLVVEGLAGLSGTAEIIPLNEAPLESIQVVASCHSLVQLEDGLVGDPQEKATLAAIDWMLTKGEAVVPRRGKMPGLRILQRHHFTAQLKRMAVVAGYALASGEISYIAAVKGAPETLRGMLREVPVGYDATYRRLSKRGARVLALGRRDLGRLSHGEVRTLTRDDLECDLTFAGFVIISCPLKRDSKEVIKEVLFSSHAAVILTGDNYLTACHVAKELKFTQKAAILVLQHKPREANGSSQLEPDQVKDSEREWMWEDLDGAESFPLSLSDPGVSEAVAKYDFCVTGEGLAYLHTAYPGLLLSLLPAIRVFARVAPKQKELVITLYKDLGITTLMCGDGTNDVGALKHAHCGVAILSGAPDRPSQTLRKIKQLDRQAEKHADRQTDRRSRRVNSGVARSSATSNAHAMTPQQEQMAKLQKLLQDFEQESNMIVKLGDASIAAPFTSKLSSIQCVCHIIKQGRCTLVTTLQMFKILALNALILAYSQSVLYLDGIKFSDYQATLQGLLLAGCFLFISRSKPLPELSKARPLPNIFNVYTIATVLLQFLSHFTCLVYLVSLANENSPPRTAKVDLEKDFEPNLLNSTVYIISLSLQISTFAINYRGRPFMESLTENRPLLYSLLAAGGLVLALTLGLIPEFGRQFEIVDFPSEYRATLLKVLVADFTLSLAVDRLCLALFGEGRLARHLSHTSSL